MRLIPSVSLCFGYMIKQLRYAEKGCTIEDNCIMHNLLHYNVGEKENDMATVD